MVIISMNMYSFSEKTNREMGILIDAKNDGSLYTKAAAEVTSILQSSERKYFNNNFTIPQKHIEVQKSYQPTRIQHGFCIRCEASIPYHQVHIVTTVITFGLISKILIMRKMFVTGVVRTKTQQWHGHVVTVVLTLPRSNLLINN